MFRRTKLGQAALLALSGTALSFSMAANAQNAERIEVTGSRILSVGAESPSPLQVIGGADIAAAGVTNIQEILLKNPTFGTPAISRTNSNFSTSSAGVATVDLRNLGTARTLVLVNGRRMVSGVPGSTAVDMNSIPTDFIERVEIMTSGASATYGSDAVAGVVNIILKKDFKGVSLDASLGESSKGDDRKQKFSLTFGSTSESGSVMGHVGYSKQGAVFSRDRDFAAVDQASEGAFFPPFDGDLFFQARSPNYSSYAPQGRFFYNATTASRTFDQSGNLISWSTNGPAGDGVGATGFNRSAYRTIAIPTERFVFASKGEYNLNPSTSAWFEGTYVATQTKTELEPFPLDAPAIYPDNGRAPAEFMVGGTKVANPIIPTALLALMEDTDGDGMKDYGFSRRLSEVGNRGNVADRDTFRIATGLKGTLFKTWDYDTYIAFGSTKESQVSSGQVNVLNFRNALESVPDVNDVNGNGSTTDAVCQDANARAQGCVPLNIFGYNTISAAAAKYIQAPGLLATYTSQKLAGGTISGEPLQLPAGPLGVAVGFEHREEFSRSEFDALQQAGLNAGNAIPRTEGKFSVNEAFAEVRVPLLKDLPAVKSLVATAAVRASDYSTVGSTSSWNAGLEWKPIADLKVRATQALTTRAPNINELYSPPSQTFPTGISDPCAGVTATSVGAKDDACRGATGVAANIAANGSFTLSQADLQGISGFDRGNPNLAEEKGKVFTLGFVYTPKFLGNVNFTADYFRVQIDDAIVSTPRQFILNQCYGGGNSSFCSFVTRRPTVLGANSAGSIEFIDSAVTNSGGVFTSGWDLTAAYSEKVGPGRLNARLAYTFVKDLYQVPLPGADKDPIAGEIGASKHKAGLTLGYTFGPFGVVSQTTYVGKASLDDTFLKDYGYEPESYGVGAKVYNDFQFTYNIGKTQLYFGLDNAFDTKAPPIITGLPGNTTGAETDAGTYDAIGRRYYAGVRMSF